MNSYERVMNCLAGKPVDRMPNMSLVMMFAAKQAGVTYGEFVSDYRLLVEGNLICYEKFGFDMFCAVSDPMREAEGFGAKVIIEPDKVPYSPVKRIQTRADIATLKVTDPSMSRRMNDRIEAVRLMREKAGKDIPVCGWIEGALAESCDLMAMDEFFMDLFDEEEEVLELLEICSEQAILFAREQVRAGADIIGVGDAASSLIGPVMYEKHALPYQQKIINAIHDMGAKVKLHICGDLNPVLHLVAKTGADIVDVDFMVDMKKAVEMMPKTTCVCGNMHPVDIIYNGTSQMVKDDVKRCMDILRPYHGIIAPGCEIPKDTPEENVKAIYDALVENK